MRNKISFKLSINFFFDLMDIKGLIIMNAYSGLPLYSNLDSEIDDTLFSGFLSAIRSFAKEISIGGLTSFVTEEMNVNLNVRNKIIVALLSPKEVPFEKINSFGYRIGERFETEFEINDNNVNVEDYKRFDEILDQLNNEKTVPFIISSANFAKKEFGGELSIQPILINRDKSEVKIDLVLDRGKKKGFATKLIKSFSEDVTFVKTVDGVAGRGEIQDFLDILKTFGHLSSRNLDDDEFPYFPARAVVIAKDFSPTVSDVTSKLARHKGKAVIPGTHIAFDAGMKGSPSMAKCFIELWKWKTNGYPERILS